MEIILEIMEDGKEIEISQVIKYMKIKYDYILGQRIFYDFWIILHQISPIKIATEEDNHAGLFEEMNKLLKGKYKTLTVEESKGILDINDRFRIKNMVLKLERDYQSEECKKSAGAK